MYTNYKRRIVMAISRTTTKEKNISATAKKPKVEKADDTVYTYCYILSTLKQREALDLTKHKAKMEKTINGFFEEMLVSVEIFKDRYILKLKEKYEIADKRRLGRLLSEQCGLKQYSRKILYNNNKDTSGQLFRICKEKDKLDKK